MDHDIIIENLYFKYANAKKPALVDINLRIKKGERILITGPAGAGKTTLCYCINGLIPHFFRGEMKGNVIVRGYNTKDFDVNHFSKFVGFLFQDPSSQLITPTVKDEIAFGPRNLGFPRSEIIKLVEEYLKFFQLEKYKDINPHDLSGGQQQACALAAVLAMKPDIYVLDEPTANLDPISSYQTLSFINKITKEQDKTVIIVEHKLEELVSLVDRAIVMNNGEIIADGDPRKVFEDVEPMIKIGVNLPQVTILFYQLKKNKILSFNSLPLTINEAYEILSVILKKNKSFLGEIKYVGKTSPKIGAEPIIKTEFLSYIYPNGTEALKNVNLEIYPGEFVAIVGQNGSGKTTLVKHFIGLLRPTKGKVFVYGMDTNRTTVSDLAKKVGFVFQNPDNQIFSRTVFDELSFGPKNLGLSQEEIERRIKVIAKLLGLTEFLKENPFNLSKGEKHIVAVASVLTMDPAVLVVDEPTTGHDLKTGKKLMDLFKQLNISGKTIIVVTHNMNFVAEYAQRVIVLKSGQVLIDGSTEEVFSQADILKESHLSPPQITLLCRQFAATSTVLNVHQAVEFFKLLAKDLNKYSAIDNRGDIC